MSFLDALATAWDALRANPIRSLLTLLGVVIGVAAVILVVAIGNGAREALASRIQSLGANLLIVDGGARTTSGVRLAGTGNGRLTDDDATAIMRDIPAVDVAVPLVHGGVETVAGPHNWPTLLNATGPGFLQAHSWNLIAGRDIGRDEYTRGSPVGMIGTTAAHELFPGQDPIGQVVRINKVPIRVVGELASKGQTTSGKDQDDTIVVPLDVARTRILGASRASPHGVETLVIKVLDGADMGEAQREITQLLRQRHRITAGHADDFTIENLEEVARIKDATTRTFALLVAGIASVSLAVGGIGIMNVMLVSVLERTPEIGVRLAVGARQRDILLQFLIEAAALAGCGGIAGVPLGIGLALFVAAFAGWPAAVSLWSILVALASAVLVGVVFGLVPARRAARLDPVLALRRA